MIERVALFISDTQNPRDGLDFARYAEQRGFEAVWLGEGWMRSTVLNWWYARWMLIMNERLSPHVCC
jgi:alkanesulfonate monooxygenase SsuD/methylene tetrahydromethanopterin reductase-like flavin-dependent oxidoreductase (luciferase family)